MDTLSQYLESTSFIGWVFEPNKELDLYWKQYQIEHPEEKNNIQQARKIILQFRVAAKSLSEEEKIHLFSSVLRKIEEKQNSKTIRRFIVGIAKYAAIAILFFSIGILLIYQQRPIHPDFYSLKLNEPNQDNKAKLIRSNGENIILKDKHSTIAYKKNGELIVDNDTVVSHSSSASYGNSLNQLIIPFGQTSEILLPDGSKVILNAGSRLAYPDRFEGNTREVMLLGEAYFEIKHDSKHPFIVLTNEMKIKDLGTKFNVSAYSSEKTIEIVLAEGKVSIKPNNSGLFDRATELTPGQLASFDSQTNQIKVKEVDANDYILWTNGIIKFESVDLKSVMRRLERFYNVKFQFDEQMLGDILISGKLGLIEDLDEVIKRIERTASVKITDNRDGSYKIKK